MISVEEAKDLVVQNTTTLRSIILPLIEATGLILAEDVYARFNVPSFQQSAMDGYAFCYDDWMINKHLLLRDVIQAGRTDKVELLPQTAIRIFTGAPLPSGADTVVMQEKTNILNGHLIIEDDLLIKGSNVRAIGAEISKGTLALQKATRLTPGAIGFLATIGEAGARVYPAPKVSIIVTGKEIQPPGTNLLHGQVYECNSFTLHAALRQLNVEEVSIDHADDEPLLIQQKIAEHLTTADVVLITGGVSVGDYDYVTQALQSCGVDQIFHKIKQRPGKPLYFGKKGMKLVFGLPGNPSSVLTCYYEYVLLAIERMMQNIPSSVTTKLLPLDADYVKKTGLTHFLKAYCTNDKVTLLGSQESFKLQAFAIANCLVCLPEEREEFKKNEMVEVHILP